MELEVHNKKGSSIGMGYNREIWGEAQGWRSCDVRDNHGVGLWKAIRQGWDVVKSLFHSGDGRIGGVMSQL